MATAQVSNRNQRAAIILKVAGLYLITVIILALLFWRNARISNEESDKLTEENRGLRQQIGQLHAMVALQDSLRDKTNLLIDLRIANPGRSSSEIQDLRVAFDDYSRQMSRLLRESSVEVDEQASTFSATRDLMDHVIAELEKLLESQDEDEENQEDQLENLDDKIRDLESQLHIEQQKVIMRDQQILNMQGGDREAGEDIQELQDRIATMKSSLVSIQSDLEGMAEEMQQHYLDTRLNKHREQLILWINKLTNMSSEFDRISR